MLKVKIFCLHGMLKLKHSNEQRSTCNRFPWRCKKQRTVVWWIIIKRNLENMELRILTGAIYNKYNQRMFFWFFFIGKNITCDRAWVKIISFVLDYWSESETWLLRDKSTESYRRKFEFSMKTNYLMFLQFERRISWFPKIRFGKPECSTCNKIYIGFVEPYRTGIAIATITTNKANFFRNSKTSLFELCKKTDFFFHKLLLYRFHQHLPIE